VITNYKAAPVIASPAAAQRLLSRTTKSEPSSHLLQHSQAFSRVVHRVLDWFERRQWVNDYERAERRYWGQR
jgi:SOS response regulatory protein OraA/RecX